MGYIPSEKGFTQKGNNLLHESGSTLKGKNLLVKGANSFFLEKTPFPKGLDVQESKREVINMFSVL